MKIDNSKVYTADLYSVKNYRQETLEAKNVVMIKFGNYYVPIWEVKNALAYMKIAFQHKEKVYDVSKFLTKQLSYPNKEGKIIKNPKHLFEHSGTTSLTELIGIQKEHSDKDDAYRGFEAEC